MHRPALAILILAICAWTPPVTATWSIVMVDRHTREIAIGSATCLTNFDLQQGVPVVVPGTGAGAAQSFVDVSGANRMSMRETLILGWRPDDILERLDFIDGQFQTRQYGIVDHFGRPATFSGSSAGEWAGGVVDVFGSISYAIQGNILTGEAVVTAAEQAIRETPGDMAGKLMAGMEAARAAGGDGRCSCQPGCPTCCGAPPDHFNKSAHIGFMIVARAGDTLGPCSADTGCAAGDYYMNFNVAHALQFDPDPVLQLQEQFDAWRPTLDGRPDAVQSSAQLAPTIIATDDPRAVHLSFTLRDWTGSVVDDPSLRITIEHHDTSAGVMTIGPVVADGGGSYHVELTTPTGSGVDRYAVTAHHPTRAVTLMPLPELHVAGPLDVNVDGAIDLTDTADFFGCLAGPATGVDPTCASADVNSDGAADMLDYSALQFLFTGAPCTVLYAFRMPTLPLFIFCGDPASTSVGFIADPVAELQWYHDGVAVPGETGPVIEFEEGGNDNRGDYHVIIKNTCGVEVTPTAELRVIPEPCK